jgi:hypothetical protein
MGSGAIRTISKTPGKKLKGRSKDEFGVGDDICNDEEKGSQEGAWPGREEKKRRAAR